MVTRRDLSIGEQAAQATHAAFDFSQAHPDIVGPWHKQSNFLVVLAAPDEAALYDLISRAREHGIVAYGVREPDCNDEITAVALQPGPIASRLCANWPLLGKQVAMT